MKIQSITNLNNYKYTNTVKKHNTSPSYCAENSVNTTFRASRNFLPNLSVTEREQFFNRLEPLNFYYNTGVLKNIAPALKSQIADHFQDSNISNLSRYLQSVGRTILDVSRDSFLILLNQDEILPDMKINGMNYYLDIPGLTIQADSKFCPKYPFFNEDDYYESPDANPVTKRHPTYLRIYG